MSDTEDNVPGQEEEVVPPTKIERCQHRLEATMAEAQATLDTVLPDLHKAIRSVKTLTNKSLQDIIQLPKPPSDVHHALQGVMVLSGQHEATNTTWTAAKKFLGLPKITQKVAAVEVLALDAARLATVQAHLGKHKGISTRADIQKGLRRSHEAAAVFAEWGVLLLDAARVYQEVEPLRRKADKLQKRLHRLQEEQQAADANGEEPNDESSSEEDDGDMVVQKDGESAEEGGQHTILEEKEHAGRKSGLGDLTIVASGRQISGTILDVQPTANTHRGNELISACKQGDLAKVMEILSECAGGGKKGLGSAKVHQVLTYCNENSSTPTTEGGEGFQQRDYSPVHCAVAWGHLDILEFLLDQPEAGTEVLNLPSPIQKRTPLYVATLPQKKPAPSSKLDVGAESPTPPIEIVKYLVHKGADPNAVAANGNFPLHIALHNSEEIVRFLVEDGGATVTSLGASKQNALQLALHLGKLDLGIWLMDKAAAEQNPFDLDYQDSLGQTALFRASYAGHLDVVKFLLDKGASPKLKTKERCLTPLHVACERRHLSIVKLLCLGKGKMDVNEGDKFGTPPLGIAAQFDASEIVEFLIHQGAKVDAKGAVSRTALRIAAGQGHIATAKLLLQKGADVEAPGDHGMTCLYAACLGAHVEMMKLLINEGAKSVAVKPANGYNVLHLAVTGKKRLEAGCVELLLADATEKGEAYFQQLLLAPCVKNATPLSWAVGTDEKCDYVPALVQAQINLPGYDGSDDFLPAFLQSVLTENTTVIRYFVKEHGIKADAALSQAIVIGKVESVKTLVELGIADLDKAPNETDGQTPLMRLASFAGSAKRAEIAKLLLAHGADPLKTDPAGCTCLHYAVTYRTLEVVEVLLEHDSQQKCNSEKLVDMASTLHGTTALHLCGEHVKAPRGGEAPAAAPARQAGPPSTTAGTDVGAGTSDADSSARCADLLLSYKANPNLKNKKGLNPLQVVIVGGQGSVPTAARLLDAMGGNAKVNTILDAQGHTLLMSCATVPSNLGVQAQEAAARIAKFLLHNGANVSKKTSATGETALTLAAFHGNLPVANVLLSHGVKDGAEIINLPDKKLRTPAHWAVLGLILGQNMRFEKTGALSKPGPGHPHQHCMDVLILLCEHKLIKIDLLDENKDTPLHLAAGAGADFCDAVEVIVQMGKSKLNLRNAQGKTAIQLAFAASPYDFFVVNLLAKAGAFVPTDIQKNINDFLIAPSSDDDQDEEEEEEQECSEEDEEEEEEEEEEEGRQED